MIDKKTPHWKIAAFVIGSLTVLLGLIVVIFVFSLSWEMGSQPREQQLTLPSVSYSDPLIRPAQPLKPPIEAVDPILGPETASITIINFSDFTCPFCQQMSEVWSEVLDTYPDQVRLVWKDVAVHSASQSVDIHKAARCAQLQGRFWDYYDAIWQYEFEGPLSEDLLQISSNIGLNEQQFFGCLTDPRVEQVVYASTEQAVNLGVGSTPAFFINDEYYEGYLSFEQVQEIIEQELQ